MTEMNEKKRRIKRRIKVILGLLAFIAIAIGLALFATRAEYFAIQQVKVEGNLFVTKEEIVLLANIKGKNIFLIHKGEIEQGICVNPYIEGITIKRSLPKTVTIEVIEKKIRGILKFKGGFINVDSQGRMVQLVNSFPNGKLPVILGLSIKHYTPNLRLYPEGDNRLVALVAAMTVSDFKESRYFFKSIKVTDPFNIVLQANSGSEVRIGDWTNIDYKIAYAITIIKSSAIKGLKGYIQLQDDGSAIFKKQREREKE